MPRAVNRSNVEHQRHSRSVTDYKKCEGRPRNGVTGEDGREEVAGYALGWATEHATRLAG